MDIKTYVPIHLHTDDSLLDGLGSINEYIEKAKEYHMPGLSKTDHGRVGLVTDFYKNCKENGINPIIGCEFYVSKGSYLDKTPENKERWHITVVAKNNIGVQNLYHLEQIAWKEGFYYKPRIDDELLFKHHEGLIVLSGCAGSELSSHLRNDDGYEFDFDKAVDIAKKFKETFGDDYYLELQDHPNRYTGQFWPVQEQINENLNKISKLLNIKRVLTADCHYANKEDHIVHEVLLCIGTGSSLSEPNRMSLDDFDLSLKSPDELFERWKNDLEPLKNTLEINEKVNVEFNLEEQIPPEFPTPTGFTHPQYLRYLAYKGVYRKLISDNVPETIEECEKALYELETTYRVLSYKRGEIVERLEMELSVINKLELNTYFLVVQEYINWANNNGIRTGPGRGSSMGSLVCYGLNITRINPLGYRELMFERFINPDRISMADIDSDFEARFRGDVINHLKELYGELNVSLIGVQSTMRSKNAVRDVARVLDYPFQESLALTKLLPDAEHTGAPKLHEYIMTDEDYLNKFGKTYDDAFANSNLGGLKQFRELYYTNQKVKEIIDIAIVLEGKIRSIGTHACATIVSGNPIYEAFPTNVSNGEIITDIPMHDIEEGGVDGGRWKIDVLGLSTLDLISDTLKMIKKNYVEIEFEDGTKKVMKKSEYNNLLSLNSNI